jgi:RNA polymerase sigma factor (sigma-70 family)
MPTGQLSKVLHTLRRAALRADGGGLADHQLLERFIAEQEEAAFAALVRRHGPMVLSVCRRVLRNGHDAEDAFQATFLVLVHKAASIRRRERLSSWLHGVAFRTALAARRARATRQAKERAMPRPDLVAEDVWQDARPLLDQELSRLPEKYRTAILLCDLEGKTHKDAARQLGCPEGTLSGRLSRARALLARRLARHGLPLSGGAVAALLSADAAGAAVEAPLVAATVKAATLVAMGKAAAAGGIPASVAALTKGVLQMMLLTKLRAATALLLAAGLIAFAVGTGARQNWAAAEPAAPPSIPPPAMAAPPAAAGANLGLPTGPAPTQVLARLHKDKLAVKMVIVSYHVTKVTTPNGDEVAAYVPGPRATTQYYELAEVKVYDTAGKKVSREIVARRLKEETPVLTSADGRKVDPLHLRLIKEGTLVLVLPRPAPPLTAVPAYGYSAVPPPAPVQGSAPPVPAAPIDGALPPPPVPAPPPIRVEPPPAPSQSVPAPTSAPILPPTPVPEK